jgi:hypothetical protein
MDPIREKIQLDKIPNFTTIQKFYHRIRSFTFSLLLNRLMKMFYDWGERILLLLSIRPGSPAPTPATTIHGEPVRLENGS